MSSRLNIAMIGAGGIGCYYGARLVSAGHRVVFVARGEHLQALNRDGLKVIHPSFDFHQAVEAMSMETLREQFPCAQFDLIILATKSGATLDFLAQMAPWLESADTPVLSIQNGVMNEVKIAHQLGRSRTLGGLAVRIGGHIIVPGVVEVAGESQIELGAWPNSASNDFSQQQLNTWVAAFNQAGIPTTNFDDIQYALWRKLIINNALNPLTALTLKNTQQVLHDPVLKQTAYQMMIETARAAKQADVAIESHDVDDMFELINGFDAIKTSMLVDREKGRPMEIDDICGPVIDYCQQSGEPATTTQLIACLLKCAVE